MVQEFRQIMLSETEVIEALEAHNRMVPHYLPYGKVTHINAIDGSSLFITVVNADMTEEKTVLFNDHDLLQALIRFCLENNIMLPRGGRKSVAINDSHISLCVRLDVNTHILSITTTCMAALSAAAL